jgi:AraC-like DNA-binding protein
VDSGGHGGYREIAPALALGHHVACYWERSGTIDRPGDVVRVLPDGCMDVLFSLGEHAAAPTVVGTMTRAILAGREEQTTLIGVRFRPGEAFAFLDVAACDAELSVADAGCPALVALADALASARDGAWAARLDAWLTSRLPSARPADPRLRHAVSLLVAARGTVRIADVASAAGVGDRRLERAFAERVGIGPKELARVLRMQGLVQRIDAELASFARASAPTPTRLGWARLAAEAGYADQAHLAREVKALSGVTPTELARERTPTRAGEERNPAALSESFKAAARAGRI